MSDALKERIRKLRKRERRHRQAVHEKYQKLYRQLHAQCIHHEWSDPYPVPNADFGTDMYNRIIMWQTCRVCGKRHEFVPEAGGKSLK